MKRGLLFAGLALVAVVAAISPFLFRDAHEVLDITARSARHTEQPGGLCPWRDSEGDRKRWYPDATQVRDDYLILTQRRDVVERELGRRLRPEEAVLRLYRFYKGATPLGTLVPRSLRGESGVIELVLAVDAGGRISGARIQRLREPDKTARTLQSPAWLGAFKGKTAASHWDVGGGLPPVPAEATLSAKAVAEGARSTLVLLSGAASTSPGEPHAPEGIGSLAAQTHRAAKEKVPTAP